VAKSQDFIRKIAAFYEYFASQAGLSRSCFDVRM